jgi:hypothetical protein
MRNLLSTISILVLCIASGAIAQEMLLGGNMEDSTAWKVLHLDSFDRATYVFNYLEGGPAEGNGGCLEVTCSGSQWANILFYQE